MTSSISNAASRTTLQAFCFPQAGADAAIFKKWEKLLTIQIEMIPVTLPARGLRIDEPHPLDFTSLCDDVFDRLKDQVCAPFVLLGSSMGGWLAYELAWRLERIGKPPSLITVLTSPAPNQPRALPALMDEARVVNDLLEFNPEFIELMQHPELVDLLLPTIVADFRMCTAYRPTEGRRTSADILAFSGRDDTVSSTQSMRPWADYTSGNFEHFEVNGGHGLHENPQPDLLEILDAEFSRIARMAHET